MQGVGALVGGLAAGALYDYSVPALVMVVAAVQVVALVMLVSVVRGVGPGRAG